MVSKMLNFESKTQITFNKFNYDEIQTFWQKWT
jgi:hypothetical protein